MIDRHLENDGFPPYPIIEDMPDLSREADRLKFAFDLVRVYKEGVADYIFAAFRQAKTPVEMVRWEMISEIVQDLLGQPLRLSYDALDRVATEGVAIDPNFDLDIADAAVSVEARKLS